MITITTENKRFTLKTDSDQSDKLFNEIVCRLIGRKPSGGAVMNAKRIAPGKADQNTDVSEKPVAEPVRREHGSDQGAADQTQSDTISEHDGYKGFLYIKCQHCGEIKSFCSKKIIKSYRCSECGTETPLKNLSHLWLNCECGRTSHYFTNMTEFAFDVNCIECGTPVAVKWNSRKKLYDTIREED